MMQKNIYKYRMFFMLVLYLVMMLWVFAKPNQKTTKQINQSYLDSLYSLLNEKIDDKNFHRVLREKNSTSFNDFTFIREAWKYINSSVLDSTESDYLKEIYASTIDSLKNYGIENEDILNILEDRHLTVLYNSKINQHLLSDNQRQEYSGHAANNLEFINNLISDISDRVSINGYYGPESMKDKEEEGRIDTRGNERFKYYVIFNSAIEEIIKRNEFFLTSKTQVPEIHKHYITFEPGRMYYKNHVNYILITIGNAIADSIRFQDVTFIKENHTDYIKIDGTKLSAKSDSCRIYYNYKGEVVERKSEFFAKEESFEADTIIFVLQDKDNKEVARHPLNLHESNVDTLTTYYADDYKIMFSSILKNNREFTTFTKISNTGSAIKNISIRELSENLKYGAIIDQNNKEILDNLAEGKTVSLKELKLPENAIAKGIVFDIDGNIFKLVFTFGRQ